MTKYVSAKLVGPLSLDTIEPVYAKYNNGPHLCVDIPDGNFTISTITSSGKRITFAFAPYTKDGEAGCVDVCYHDSGETISNNAEDLPAFKLISFTPGGGKELESTTTAILLDDSHYEK